MANPPNPAPLPAEYAYNVALLRDEPHDFGYNSPASRFVGYVSSGNTADVRTERLEQVQAALGTDVAGREAFATVLRGAQSPMLQDQYDSGRRFHEAFAKMVDAGRWTTADTRSLVALEARFGGDGQQTVAPGTIDRTMATLSARQSSYFEGLGDPPARSEVRSAFVAESLKQAAAVVQTRPSTSEHLYAQAAQVMADQSTTEIKAHLAELRAHDPDAVARFALGAMGGMADRTAPADFPTPRGPVNYSVNGLPRVIEKLTEDVRASAAAGHPDRDAEVLLAQTVTGALRYGSIAQGTPAETSLLEHDERTGLRDALNGAMRTDFNAILRANSYSDGNSLNTGGGFDTFSNYTRYQFGAPDDASGRRTARDAQEILSEKLGRLEGDLLKAGRDGGADLLHDFGPRTFGAPAQAQGDAAHTLGALFASIRNGLNAEFDVRADRARGDQRETKELFHRTGEVAELAGKVAARVGGEGATGVFETIGGIAKSLEDNTPMQTTPENGRTSVFEATENRFSAALADGRPGSGLRSNFGAGEVEGTAQWSDYKDKRDHEKINAEAALSQRGALAQGLQHIVPHAERVAPPNRIDSLDAKTLSERLAAAVTEFNAAGHGRTLQLPRSVEPWDGTNRTGTVLRLTEDEYAISTGKGGYQVFSTERTNGVHPIPDRPLELHRDGTIHQEFAPAQQQQR